jgi:hypothetical protein
LFLHAPEAALVDVVLVEVVDMDDVALVIRFVVVDKIIRARSLAWYGFYRLANK